MQKSGYHTRNIDTSKTLTLDQINLLIEKSKDTKIYLMVLMNVLMGLRCSEIIAVKYSDVDYICCSTYGRPRSKNYHWQHYKKLLADNGLPDIRWHDLRSTYCTLLLKNNYSPKAVSKLMGHAKEIITMDARTNVCYDCTN